MADAPKAVVDAATRVPIPRRSEARVVERHATLIVARLDVGCVAPLQHNVTVARVRTVFVALGLRERRVGIAVGPLQAVCAAGQVKEGGL